jgi:peptide-methionine (S)-S-oxide reductase
MTAGARFVWYRAVMSIAVRRRRAVTLSLAGLVVASLAGAGRLPDPVQDSPIRTGAGEQTAVLAGGCFWGVEAVFDRVNGVTRVVSGYAGGSKATARYDVVSAGRTRHAEAVRITYDPARVTFGQLLKVFFSVVHDPTELNRQGPDEGPQYRSSIFYVDQRQKEIAEAYIQQLGGAKIFRRRIATTVVPLGEGFFPAEDYHQKFLDRNPTYPYIVIHDLPKLEALRREYPELVKRR